jgi:hypothetical protein
MTDRADAPVELGAAPIAAASDPHALPEKSRPEEREKIDLEETKLGLDTESITSPVKEGQVQNIDDPLPPSWFTRTWRRHRLWGHVLIWILTTVYPFP